MKLTKSFIIGAAIVSGVLVLAVFAPIIASHDYTEKSLARALRPPSWFWDGASGHPLGTDHLGRDLFSRILFGARVSMIVGVVASLIAGLIGVPLGLVAALGRGYLDSLLMRLADIQLAFPPIFVVIAIIAFLGDRNIFTVAMVVGFATWVQYARVTRSAALSVREREFIMAARSIGAGELRIMVRHVLPNIISPIVVIGAISLSSNILIEAALSFLGLGVQPPTPAWGSMLSEGREYFRTAWWCAAFPGVAIVLTVFGINLLSDGLTDVLP